MRQKCFTGQHQTSPTRTASLMTRAYALVWGIKFCFMNRSRGDAAQRDHVDLAAPIW